MCKVKQLRLAAGTLIADHIHGLTQHNSPMELQDMAQEKFQKTPHASKAKTGTNTQIRKTLRLT